MNVSGISLLFIGSTLCMLSLPVRVHAQGDCSDRPEWLTRPPSSESHYTGVGGVQKRPSLSINDVQEIAYQNALNDIALSIYATIKLEDKRDTIDDGKQVEDIYERRASHRSEAVIQGAEMVDSWDCPEEYAVYLRYSKDTHNRNVSDARASALGSFQQAEEVLGEENPGEAFQHLISGWDRFAPFDYEQEIKPVKDDAEALLGDVLKEIEVLPVIEHFDAITGMPLPQPVSVRVVSRRSGKPVPDVPVHFSFQKGSGNLDSLVWTDAKGLAASNVHLVHGNENAQTILATLDVEQLVAKTTLPSEAKSDVITAVKARPNGRVTLSVTSPQLYVELGDRDEFCDQYVLRELKGLLTKDGDRVFVNNRENAHISLACTAEVLSETYSPSLKQTLYQYEGRVSLIDLRTGEEYCATSHRSQMGGESAAGAASRAFTIIRNELNQSVPACLNKMLKGR